MVLPGPISSAAAAGHRRPALACSDVPGGFPPAILRVFNGGLSYSSVRPEIEPEPGYNDESSATGRVLNSLHKEFPHKQPSQDPVSKPIAIKNNVQNMSSKNFPNMSTNKTALNPPTLPTEKRTKLFLLSKRYRYSGLRFLRPLPKFEQRHCKLSSRK